MENAPISKPSIKCLFTHDDVIISNFTIPPSFKTAGLLALPEDVSDEIIAEFMQSTVIIVYKCNNCGRVKESVHKNFKI